MPDIDWESEVNERTPGDVLRFFLDDPAAIDHLIVVGYFNDTAKREDLRGTVVKMSNCEHSYLRVGLLHEALNMEQAGVHPTAVEDA